MLLIMKVVIQRVTAASVEVKGQSAAAIEKGLVLLCGFGKTDSDEVLQPMANRIANLRIFPDANGWFHYSALDIEADILAVPQFTLFADTQKGRRPEFFSAMEPKSANDLFHKFIAALVRCGFAQS